MSLCRQFFHQCPRCGYELRMLRPDGSPVATCPECGTPETQMLTQYGRKLWRDDLRLVLWIGLVVGVPYAAMALVILFL